MKKNNIDIKQVEAQILKLEDGDILIIKLLSDYELSDEAYNIVRKQVKDALDKANKKNVGIFIGDDIEIGMLRTRQSWPF